MFNTEKFNVQDAVFTEVTKNKEFEFEIVDQEIVDKFAEIDEYCKKTISPNVVYRIFEGTLLIHSAIKSSFLDGLSKVINGKFEFGIAPAQKDALQIVFFYNDIKEAE